MAESSLADAAPVFEDNKDNVDMTSFEDDCEGPSSSTQFTRSSPVDIPTTCVFQDKAMVDALHLFQRARLQYRIMSEQQSRQQ